MSYQLFTESLQHRQRLVQGDRHRDLGEVLADEADVLVEAGEVLGEESAELLDGLGELLKRVKSQVVHAVDGLAFESITVSSRGILLLGPT